MRVVVLGSAAGGGFPQWNCACRACELARAATGRAKPRTQSSLAVSAEGRSWFLLNASPDLRAQILATPALAPAAGLRHSPIAGVVLTNADVDHIAGLLTLRENHRFTVYATPRVLDVIAANPVFGVLNRDLVRRQGLALDEAVPLCHAEGEPSGLTLQAFPVPGKIALYLEDPAAGSGLGTVPQDTIGLRLSAEGDEASLFYIPGCAAMTDGLADRLRGADTVFFDGTVWSDNEMPQTGVGAKTGQRMGHMCMAGPNGSIAAFRDLGVRRKIFVHINNTNPVLIEGSAEQEAARAAGWEIAEDGMEIVL